MSKQTYSNEVQDWRREKQLQLGADLREYCKRQGITEGWWIDHGWTENQVHHMNEVFRGEEPLTLLLLGRVVQTLGIDVDIRLEKGMDQRLSFNARLIARAVEPILEDLHNGR